MTASVAGMAAAKDDPVSVEDKDNIEALLDDADRLSSTISRPFSGLSTVLARIRAASIAQKKELDATLESVKTLSDLCQQMHAGTVEVQEALKANLRQAEEMASDPVGDPPRLASHANRPGEKRPRLIEPRPGNAHFVATHTASILASSGASSGAAGGAAGGAAEGVAGQGFSEICPVTKCLVSQCLHCWPLSDE